MISAIGPFEIKSVMFIQGIFTERFPKCPETSLPITLGTIDIGHIFSDIFCI